jgi:type I restriction enzyme M protein
MLRMMKTGGRCAVIVPDGVLFGSSNAHKQIRGNHRKPQTRCRNLYAKECLNPMQLVQPCYFLPKNRTGGTDKVWFDMQADGYTLMTTM